MKLSSDSAVAKVQRLLGAAVVVLKAKTITVEQYHEIKRFLTMVDTVLSQQVSKEKGNEQHKPEADIPPDDSSEY